MRRFGFKLNEQQKSRTHQDPNAAQVQSEAQMRRAHQTQIAHQILRADIQELAQYYPYKNERQLIDSRCYITFSKAQLIALLVRFAALNNHQRDPNNSTVAPLFGFTESCFTDFLIYALKTRAVEATNQELRRSQFGKNLIRNLLHTASTCGDLGLDYKTEPETKACYISLFQEACRQAENPTVESSTDCVREPKISRPTLRLSLYEN